MTQHILRAAGLPATLLMALALTWLGLSARADETVVAGLSQNEVSITANFNGSEILIFGAVERYTPLPEGGDPLQVIITIEGPDQPVTVRRMDRQYGIWMNSEEVLIDAAPTFYSVATTAPFDEIISDTEDLRHRISIPRAIRAVDTSTANQRDFTQAVIRIRTNEGLYQLLEGTVTLRNQTLFDTSIGLPSNLVEGDYTARIFLTRSREVVASYETQIAVRKVGLERMIYTLAYNQPVLYGLLSIVIAVIAGWLASAIFRYLRLG